MRRVLICFAFLAALTLNAQETPSQKALAFERQEDWKQAEAAWREVIRRAPTDGAAHAHLGLVLAREQEYAEAVEEYRKALALKTSPPGIELNLGLALFKQEKMAEAIGPLKAAVSKAPDNMQAQVLLGMCYYATAQYEQALPYLKKAVEKSPDNLQLHTVLAQSCLWAKQYDCTLEEYKQILQLNPESAQADMLAGEAMDGLNDAEGAIRQFEAAVKAAPNEPNVHFGLGYLLWKRHSFPEAAEQFKQELANDPNHAQALAYLGDIDIKQNDNASALPLLEKAVKQPGHPALRLSTWALFTPMPDARRKPSRLSSMRFRWIHQRWTRTGGSVASMLRWGANRRRRLSLPKQTNFTGRRTSRWRRRWPRRIRQIDKRYSGFILSLRLLASFSTSAAFLTTARERVFLLLFATSACNSSASS